MLIKLFFVVISRYGILDKEHLLILFKQRIKWHLWHSVILQSRFSQVELIMI